MSYNIHLSERSLWVRWSPIQVWPGEYILTIYLKAWFLPPPLFSFPFSLFNFFVFFSPPFPYDFSFLSWFRLPWVWSCMCVSGYDQQLSDECVLFVGSLWAHCVSGNNQRSDAYVILVGSLRAGTGVCPVTPKANGAAGRSWTQTRRNRTTQVAIKTVSSRAVCN